MTITRVALLVSLMLVAGPAMAQVFAIPPGAYRTGAAYHRHQPELAGVDAFYPDKRGQVVVVVPRNAQKVKVQVAPDSVWGYVSAKGRTTRLFRGEEYRLEFADTLCVYSSTTAVPTSQTAAARTNGQPVSPGPMRYYFSRGLTGLIFPLTPHYLREAYEASNPAFVAAIVQLRFTESPADFDRKTGLFRVTTLYRQAVAEKR